MLLDLRVNRRLGNLDLLPWFLNLSEVVLDCLAKPQVGPLNLKPRNLKMVLRFSLATAPRLAAVALAGFASWLPVLRHRAG